MFDSKIACAVPSKVVRFGIGNHGLVLTNATKSSLSFETIVRNQRILTHGGKLVTMPVAETTMDQVKFAGSTIGPCCIYMHPRAEMDTEDESGNDFSGYVVFDIGRGSGFGYVERAAFAFTPDDESQGMLYDAGLSYIYPQLTVDYRLPRQSDAAVIPLPDSANWTDVIHISSDGRTIYYAYVYSASDIAKHNPPSQPALAVPFARFASLTGGMVDGNAVIDAVMTESTQPPLIVTSNEFRDVAKYGFVAFTAIDLPIERCVTSDLAYDIEVENSVDSIPVYAQIRTETFIDSYKSTTKVAPVFASVIDGEFDYVNMSIKTISAREANGFVSGSVDVVFGAECELRLGGTGNILDDVIIHAEARSSSTQTETVEVSLQSTMGSSKASVTSTLITDYSQSWGYEFGVYTPGNSALSIELDGSVVFSDDDNLILSRLLLDPQMSTQPYIRGLGSTAHAVAYVQDGDPANGARWLRVTFADYNYNSKDVIALAVVIERGFVEDYNTGGSRPSKRIVGVTTEIHIGKSFSRGIVDPESFSGAVEFPSFAKFRAYDPLNKQLSQIYDFPVYYI